MAGRRPKSTHLRVVGGNAGHRAIRETEPRGRGALTEPPAWMGPDYLASWAYAIANAPKGMLKRIDSSTLAVWVVADALHRQAAQRIGELGLMVGSPKKNVPMQNPYVSILNKQAAIMLRAAAELGFTPAARPRISVARDDDANPFADLI